MKFTIVKQLNNTFKVAYDSDYETDKVFKKLVKLEKQARTEKMNYINKMNTS